MPVLWQRVVVTALAMALASLVAAELWRAALGFDLPSYLSGLVGGAAAIPVWALCKRIKPRT